MIFKNHISILMNFKYIIVGGGLAGLSVGYQFMKSGVEDFIILEGRNRIGGRVLTEKGTDLGAIWFQQHHLHIRKILEELGMVSFEQYILGKGIIVSKPGAPIHYFEEDSNNLPAYRIAGGSIKLVERMVEGFSNKIRFETEVIKIENTSEGLIIQARNEIFKCHNAAICIPPRLASRIDFKPDLPSQLSELMQKTYTWMSQAIKFGLTFSNPFWREKGFSGVVFGQSSPITEMYDHSSLDETVFGLMGFINEEFRGVSREKRKQIILDFLENLFGKEIRNYIIYSEKDWAKDNFTSIKGSGPLPYKSFYGNVLFNKPYYNGKLFFAAAEMSYINAGYMDGAIANGFESANKMIENIT